MLTYCGKHRDSQRSKVYRWERDKIFPMDKELLLLDDCKSLIEEVFDRYALPMPDVADGRGTTRARGSTNRINLPRWARTRPVILHESAHGIADRFDATSAWHGPLFMRIYIDLIHRYMGKPITEIRRSARERRIRVGKSAACKPHPRKLVVELKKAREDVQRLQEIWQNSVELDKARKRYRTLYNEVWHKEF